MHFPRVILAHVCSVFAASSVIIAGMGFVNAGFVGVVDRFSGWIGGFLIFSFLSVCSLPIGLLLRSIVGRLPVSPKRVSVGTGIAVAVALIPVLHPAMMPSMSFASHLFQLLAVHGTAGAVGGWLWWAIEQPNLDVTT
jgi:hypothetical protein